MKVFLIGLPGSGKSYWAKILSAACNIPSIDLDEEIEKLAKKSIDYIFKEAGEQQFRMLEQQALKLICASPNSFILACGGGTPCFHDNLETINKSGISIYLKSSSKQIISHLRTQNETEKRPLLKEGSLEVKLEKLLNDRSAYYEKANHIFDMDRLQENEIVAKVKTLLNT